MQRIIGSRDRKTDRNEPYVVWEDRQLLMVRKPPGWLSQEEAHPTLPSIEQWAVEDLRRRGISERPFVKAAHRLDAPVEGLLCLARTSKALARLHAAQREGEWHKVYLVLTVRPLPKEEETLIHHLVQEEGRARVVGPSHPEGQEARLTYRRLAGCEALIELHTGRYHQIRAQLAALKCPVEGDLKYGAPQPQDGIALAHVSLQLRHPVSAEELCFRYVPEWASPAARDLLQSDGELFPCSE
ncbi:MAG: RluA family pseudouridine synthase [Chlamydiia bacterium]